MRACVRVCVSCRYALYLSHVMVKVQQFTHDGKRMGELSMVYYNNLLSLGPGE